jgi:hypothetical protein
MSLRKLALGVMGAVVLAAAACSSSNVLGPDNNVEVTNDPDDFAFQASALDNVSQTLSFQWTMTGTVANVDQSGSLTGGSATLTIRDQNGVEVYSRSLAQTGTFQTTAGAEAGTWTISVNLDGASGTLNFRVQKP